MSEPTREPDDDPALLEVAGSVAGGEAVDWQAAEARAGAERGPVVRALHLIAKIAEVHRSLQRTVILEDSHSFAAPSGDAPPMPARWGDLELLERVGEGASADVYRARDTRLQREVALKLLRRPPSRGETGNEAVLREGRLLAKVRHANVATVYGVDEHDGRVGVSMEYVRGKTLSRLIAEQGPQSAREASGIGIDLCRALAAVHEKGVVHRDLKAQNVMREEGGRTLLVDFGIGRDLEAEDDGAPSLSGTPLYLAPEIFDRRPATAQSDLYSLGVLLFYLVTGKFPVMGGSLAELRAAHQEGRAALLRDLRPDLPAWFVQTVERALERDPAARFRSAGQMERALEAGAGSVRGAAVDETSSRRRVLRWPWLAAAALALVAASAWWIQLGSPGARAQEHYEVAKRRYDDDDVQGALAAGMKSVEIDPTNPRTQNLMAMIYGAAGQLDKEKTAADLARQFAGRLPPAERHEIAGNSLLVQLDYERAAAEYSEAFRLDPKAEFSRRQLAMIYGKLGKPRKAVELLAGSCSGGQANWVSCGELCLATAQDRGVEAGIELLESLPAELRETKSNVGWSEGVLWLAAGNLELAERSFARLAQADDTYASEGSMFLSEVDLLRGRLHEAKQDLTKGFVVDTRGEQVVVGWRRRLALAESGPGAERGGRSAASAGSARRRFPRYPRRRGRSRTRRCSRSRPRGSTAH